MRQVTTFRERNRLVDVVLVGRPLNGTIRSRMQMERTPGKESFNGVGTWCKRTQRAV
jgi:hypothetical protein